MSRALSRSLWIPAVVASALHFAAATEPIQTPAGGLRNAGLADLKPHPNSSKTYNEFWTYQILLDGNIQIVLNFSRVNLGTFKAPVCGADLTILGFKGKNLTVAREYEKKNFIFTDSNQQLQVHEKIWFNGKLPESHRVHFATSKNGVNYYLDLDFSDIAPGKVWGDGMFKFGSSDAVGIFIHIPSAKVKGRLAVNSDTVEVKGTAYMDHTVQTDLAPDLVGAGYRYVAAGSEPEAGYYLAPITKYESVPVGYGLRMVSKDSAVLLKPTAMHYLSAARALGVRVPTLLEIQFRDNCPKVTLERKEDRLQQSTLHEFSGFAKMAIKSFMGGEVLTFKGCGTLNGSRPMSYDYFIVD